MPHSIIDSHVHLWPSSTANTSGHSWMTPGHVLAKPHLPADYLEAVAQLHGHDSRSSDNDNRRVEGLVFIETDAFLSSPSPSPSDLSSWARGPLREIEFLRDTFFPTSTFASTSDSISTLKRGGGIGNLLLAAILWAPLDQPASVLLAWLKLAEDMAGPALWERVRGFRWLLQGIKEREEFGMLLRGDGDFVRNLRLLSEMGFVFEVGVDQRQGGIWQLETMVEVVEEMQRGIRESGEGRGKFVLNNMCKPDFGNRGEGFERWCEAMEGFARCKGTYVKLSGALNEVPDELRTPEKIATCIKPWVEHLLRCFGPERVMFGSDWPVCNIRGPEEGATWAGWTEVVAIVLDNVDIELSSEYRERIWRGTAIDVYNLG